MFRIAIATAAAAASFHAYAGAAGSYTIVDLGPYDQPFAVNAQGTLVGFSDAMHNEPIVYLDGAWRTLPNNTGVSQALAINDKGVIVGYDAKTQVLWKNGQRKKITGTQRGLARGIADDGTIVGDEVEGAFDSCYEWKSGVKTTLGGFGVEGNCRAYAIDSTATYIGGYAATSSGDNHAFLMDATGTHDLGTLNDTLASSLKAVNRRGHAAVWSTFDVTSVWGAAYWNGKRLVDIGMHAPGVQSLAMAINDNDDVLVVGSDGQGHVAFLYSGRTGVTTALEPLISNPEGWTFNYGAMRMLTAIGNDGVIYGETYFQNVPHAFKLVPGTRQAGGG